MSKSEHNPRFSIEIVKAAYDAYQADTDDWLEQWEGVFTGLAMASEYALYQSDGELNLKVDWEFSAMMQVIAEVLLDQRRGASHPKFAPKKVAGRPPANTEQLRYLGWAQVLIGMQLHSDKGKVSAEASFRQVAKRMRAHGADIGWKQCRSIWSNRKRTYNWRTTEYLLENITTQGFDSDLADRLANLCAGHLQ